MTEQNQKKSVIVLLGAPGSGKGTQAKDFSKAKNIPHISTGELFRYHMSSGTELGNEARKFINQGALVPDEMVLLMLYERISLEDCRLGYLLDGFPRTIPQAESFEKFLTPNEQFFVINLAVSPEVIVKRIAGRLSCPHCGNVQNRYFSPPKQDGICDKCGSHFILREDDQPEVVKKRLESYFDQTAPLVDYYERKGVLRTINGELPSNEIAAKIMACIS